MDNSGSAALLLLSLPCTFPYQNGNCTLLLMLLHVLCPWEMVAAPSASSLESRDLVVILLQLWALPSPGTAPGSSRILTQPLLPGV